MGSATRLDAVIANDELKGRPPRSAGSGGLEAALAKLESQLAASPRLILQMLTDTTLQLLAADSAGVSLVETDGGRQVFRWHAVSGAWASLLWTTLPREFSPCGTVLDRGAAQLMIRPERYFTPLLQISPRVEEVLLIPFAVRGRLVGTLWVVAHDANRKFDSGDHAMVSALAAFAAEAYAKLSTLSEDDAVRLSRARFSTVPSHIRRAAVQKRVLVVDDNRDAADMLARVLRTFGHDVRVAYDGHQALQEASALRPDVALLDIAMPGMSGYVLARRLRDEFGADMRIIALTAHGREEDRADALAAGFDQHLVKPVDPAFLKSLLG